MNKPLFYPMNVFKVYFYCALLRHYYMESTAIEVVISLKCAYPDISHTIANCRHILVSIGFVLTYHRAI